MYFASDNAGPAHPKVLAALTRANETYAKAYGEDTIMDAVRTQIRSLFEAPEAAVYLVATGTAANALTLASMAKPWDTIFCPPTAHINEDECNAPEFYTGGTKLTLVSSEDGKMSNAALRKAIEAEQSRGVHGPQRGPVSLSQATEKGSSYSCAQIAAIGKTAGDFELKLHMDGARFANALSFLGCSPAEMSWRAGVSALSFGGTKNGLLGVEAVVLFDPQIAWEFELRRKRGGHLFSKHRFLSAQMLAYLEDDLWLDMAAAANASSAALAGAITACPATELVYSAQSNLLFFNAPRRVHKALHDAGAVYYLWNGEVDNGPVDETLTGRLVCDWSMPQADVAEFVALLEALS
ncbi:MAG: low specificity L-threonine aldolase [Rhodobacteraceae bacterium]|nr:low specificity L-threonine aldolase [Paracoccaceae bacterium]